MSWAARRRLIYLSGVILFFAVVVGGPLAYHFLTIPATCHDGIQNQGETSPDHGGPCLYLDASALQPEGILWARTFKVRDGLFDAVAYIDNPNQSAGVINAPYSLSLYDSQNVLVADVSGTTSIMPGGITPVFIGGIDTGFRDAVHAQFAFTGPLTWERVVDVAPAVRITNSQYGSQEGTANVTASAGNASISTIHAVDFVATVFDSAGNAIASSQTALPSLDPGADQQIFFTWPNPFSSQVGRVDIIPIVAPTPDPSAQY